MFESRNWKRAMGFILSKRCQSEIGKKVKNKSFDMLFNKCSNIYSSLNYLNKLVDTSETSEKSEESRLTKYFKMNHEKLQKKYNEWKNLVIEIKKKQEEIFAEKKNFSIEKFRGLVNLMESIIQMQEEKLEKNKIERINSSPGKFDNDLDMLVDLGYMESQKKINQNLLSTYADNSNFDYNLLHKEVDNIIKEFSNEVNAEYIEQIKIASIKKPEKKISSNIPITKSQKISDTINTDFNNSLANPLVKRQKNASEIGINSNIDKNRIINESNDNSTEDYYMSLMENQSPMKMMFKMDEDMGREEIEEFLRMNFNTDFIYSVPNYNPYDLIGCEIDLNSEEYEKDNLYHKLFPLIKENNDIKKDNIFYNNIVADSKKISEQKETKYYKSLTVLQKMIILYAMLKYGKNSIILINVLNTFPLTHCLNFSKEEMDSIKQRILDEFNISIDDSFTGITNNNEETFDFETSIYSEQCYEFEYNRIIRSILESKEKNKEEIDELTRSLNELKINECHKKNAFKVKSVNIVNSGRYPDREINKRYINSMGNLVFRNNFIRSDLKKKLLKEVLSFVSGLCEEIIGEEWFSKYNYFTGEETNGQNNDNNCKRLVNDMDSYNKEISNQNKKLEWNKVELLSVLRGSEYNQQKMNYRIKSTQNNNEINNEEDPYKNPYYNSYELRIINSKENSNIKSLLTFHNDNLNEYEWKTMRKRWFQNHHYLNPLFNSFQNYSFFNKPSSMISNTIQQRVISNQRQIPQQYAYISQSNINNINNMRSITQVGINNQIAIPHQQMNNEINQNSVDFKGISGVKTNK